MKYTGLFILLGGAALALSFALFKHTRARPTLGPLSDQWLFERRRHSDEQ